MTTPTAFDEVGRNLSPQDCAELFQVLHEAGIGPEDRDLAKLFRALQIYKSFYEEIPSRVSEALEQADILGVRIKSLHESMATCMDRALAQLARNTEAHSRISDQFRETETLFAGAVEKSAAEVVLSLEAVLRKSLSTGLLEPFEISLHDIRDQCVHTAGQAKRMTSELKLARRIHIGAYGLAAVVISMTLVLASWFVAARHYSRCEAELLQRIDQNRQVLSELARKGAVLEVRRDPADSQTLYLLLKRAKTWTTDKHVVVEMK